MLGGGGGGGGASYVFYVSTFLCCKPLIKNQTTILSVLTKIEQLIQSSRNIPNYLFMLEKRLLNVGSLDVGFVFVTDDKGQETDASSGGGWRWRSSSRPLGR